MIAARPRTIARPQRGYSLIELSVALVIALFLLSGMFMVLQNTRKTSDNQDRLAQLQDEERIAMTLLTDVIQQAGYYPNAGTIDASTVFVTSPNFPSVGQVVAAGTPNAGGDVLTVRYQGDATGNVLDCRGAVIPNGTLEEMTFSVQTSTNNKGGRELFCTVNGVQVPLVPNVRSLTVSYGIDTNSSGAPNAYLTQAQIAALTPDQIAAFWNNVYSVKLTVGFLNPLYGQPGQTQQTISFSRVIGLMAKTGVNVLKLY
jgi:type IV pilus assembly protein PilW